MGSMLLIVGLIAVAGSLATIVLAMSVGAGASTGVAKSLELIEKTVSAREVSKSDLPVMERIVMPLLAKTRALANKLSPTGTQEGLTRRLDLAGNPGTWTAERIMGGKGAGLLIGAVLGLLFGGFS